jgi:hypothetical protein
LFWTQKLENSLKEYSNSFSLYGITTNISLNQFHCYSCVSLLIGIYQFPNQRDHWSDSEVVSNKLIPRILSCNDFEYLPASIHFDIEKIVKHLNANFKQYWKPLPYVSIDETMVPFKGRYRYRQHTRGKPHAIRITIYLLVDEVGFIYVF